MMLRPSHEEISAVEYFLCAAVLLLPPLATQQKAVAKLMAGQHYKSSGLVSSLYICAPLSSLWSPCPFPPVLPSVLCVRRSRGCHSRGFSYRLTRFDVAVTPVLCHGAHGCGWGVLCSAPQSPCWVRCSPCYVRDCGFTGEGQSLHWNVPPSSLP